MPRLARNGKRFSSALGTNPAFMIFSAGELAVILGMPGYRATPNRDRRCGYRELEKGTSAIIFMGVIIAQMFLAIVKRLLSFLGKY